MATAWASRLVMLPLFVLAVGCGSPGEGDGNGPDGTGGKTASPGLVGPSRISASTLAALLPQASDFQKRLLSDGELSMGEYESAQLARISCLKDGGLAIVGEPKLDGLFRYRFTIAAPSTESGPPPAIGACYREFASVVDMVWAEVSMPMIQGTIRESRRLMAECYAENGLKPGDHSEDSPDPEVRGRYKQCFDKVGSALNIEGISYGVEGDGRPQ